MINMGEIFAHERIGNIEMERVPMSDREVEQFSVKTGDLLFARQSLVAAGAGKCSLVKTTQETTTFESHLIRVRLDQHRCVPEFYFYYFLSPLGKANVQSLVMQVAAAGIRGSELAKLNVPVPPLPIQRRIVGILSAYDELIENSQRRIKILEAMARALYREWFVHFRFPGHESVPRVPSPLGKIPQGWEVKPLGSLMAGHIGGGWGKAVPDEKHSEPAWVIRGTDIPDARRTRVADVPHRYHTPSSLRSRKLIAGDIVFEVSGGSKGQPVGRTLLITPKLRSAFDGDLICASFCKRVQPDANGYGSELLYLSFLEGYESGEIEQFQVQSTGISNFKWTEYIAKIERVVPPEPLRSRFREQVATLLTQIAVIGLQTQNLRRTRDLLLPRLLSGQIDVANLADPVAA